MGEGNGEMGEDGKGEGSGEGKVVGKWVRIARSWKGKLLFYQVLVAGQERRGQHEGVKEGGKELIETPIPTNVGHNYGLIEISSKSNGLIGNPNSPNMDNLRVGYAMQHG